MLADFSHTAIINIIVTTLAGDVIPDVVIESTSGNFGTTPVPVPPSLAMLGSALALLARLRRRR
ncbi:MAG: PEP-CTERM sorting domain-containing protein [Proteobacteria bacterium]|nr:PEP-CTERM sorting domain-containing protein [Pseudomonadota bacterium]